MIFKVFVILLFASAVFCQNLSEGDRCDKDGAEGMCLKLAQCKTALEEIQQDKRPKICSFDKLDSKVPIVCCVERTPKRPPPVVPYNNEDKCEPMSAHMTPPKIGKKAFDKCIDYQQKYVYPCERGTALTGAFSRHNKCHLSSDSLINGGTDAHQHEFPHMALLGYGPLNTIEWECGGSIISERFILTAGHCTYRKRNDPVTYVVIGVLRRMDANDPSKIYKVKKIIGHPDYKSPRIFNDIALIETEKVMKLNQFTVPACLHTGDFVNDTQVLATGWGNTQSDGSYLSEILQRVPVVLSKLPINECSKIYKPNRNNMRKGYDDLTQSCYGDRGEAKRYQDRFQNHKDTCQGDSGGPIQIKDQKIHCMYTIVGIIATGKPKCGHKASVYTRVAKYLSWIEDTVWPN